MTDVLRIDYKAFNHQIKVIRFKEMLVLIISRPRATLCKKKPSLQTP
jgi:hypothetical protein